MVDSVETRILFVGAVAEIPGLKLPRTEWKCSQTLSAEKALELCVDHSYDLVVTSNRLPKLDGTELLRTIKHIAPSAIRMLVIEPDEVEAFRTLVCDAQQILVKPLVRKRFVEKLKNALALRSVINDPTILKVLGDADALPPLPRIFGLVCEKLGDDETALSEVAAIISEDIVLSSRVLKLANSALFSPREPIGDIGHAVAMLGGVAVSALVFAYGVTDSFKRGAVTDGFAEQLHRHSVECAVRASNILLARGGNLWQADQVFFCGIAHNLGKLVLASLLPMRWKKIQDEIATGNHGALEAERMLAGASHCELAAYLMAVWGFPLNMVEAVAYHHEPSRAPNRPSELLCALHLADNLCENNPFEVQLDWQGLAKAGISKGDFAELEKNGGGAGGFPLR